MSPYATHIPTLERALSMFGRPGLIVELGPGDFSTPLLAAGCDRLVCLEMNDPAWAEKAAAVPNVEAMFDSDPDAWRRFVAMKPDVLFVDQGTPDAHLASRGPAVQAALDAGIRQIVAHDTEDRLHYGYDAVRVPEGYRVHTDYSRTPWTTHWWKE